MKMFTFVFNYIIYHYIISIGTMQEMHRPFLPFSTNFKILNFFFVV